MGTNISPVENGKPVLKEFPPTVWVVMERDGDSQKEARAYVSAFMKNKVPADVVVSPIRAITPDFLANRIPGLSNDEASEVVRGLRHVGLIDDNGQFKMDPKAKGWNVKLKKAVPSVATKKELALAPFNRSPLMQALLMAYAKHEHVADYTTACLLWFESDGKKDFDELAKKHAVTNPSKLLR